MQYLKYITVFVTITFNAIQFSVLFLFRVVCICYLLIFLFIPEKVSYGSLSWCESYRFSDCKKKVVFLNTCFQNYIMLLWAAQLNATTTATRSNVVCGILLLCHQSGDSQRLKAERSSSPMQINFPKLSSFQERY